MSKLLKGWKIHGSKIFRTDQMGEITIVVNSKEKIKIKRFIE